jgi:hypothetical protein
MTDRPTHLVIVTHAGHQAIDLFSAHYTESAARTVHSRLQALLAKTGSAAHMVEVPETEGVVEASEPVAAVPVASSAPAAAQSGPVIPPAEKPAPFKRLSAEQFAEETRALLEADANAIVTDTPMPKYDGAFS